jgi:hypothetical protein
MKTYPEDEVCAGCGISHATARAEGHIRARELLRVIECPTCGHEGCDVCMPAGLGVPCPDCEMSDDQDL